MKVIFRRLATFMLAMIMIVGLVPTVAFAATGGDDCFDKDTSAEVLATWVSSGNGVTNDDGEVKSADSKYSNKTYKVDGGGTLKYSQMFLDSSSGDETLCYLNKAAFDKLNSDGKRKFLEDYFSSANACVYFSDSKKSANANAVSDETVTDVYNNLQSVDGMGTLLMASLLQNTKPNFVAANNIYAPFSGVVGTILGFLSIIIMALLGVTMALDILYITIPAFQLIIGDAKSGQGQQNGAAKIGAKIVSTEAIKAVEVSQAGQNGEYKSAIGTYFGYRWKSLVLLGICLLYLVSGQIYTLVAKIIDLLSGFLGF